MFLCCPRFVTDTISYVPGAILIVPRTIGIIFSSVVHTHYFFIPTEAMEAILAYTKDAEELLKRKKVHRDIIFKYLAKEGVVVPPNTEKHQLVKKTLEFWSFGKVGAASQVT